MEFTSSLSLDKELYPYDILGSKVHVKMLHKSGILSKEERDKLLQGLEEIKEEMDEGKFVFQEDEDIHMAIERALKEKVGELANKLHTARSRNDQVALDERLYLMEAIPKIKEKIRQLQEAILLCAEKNLKVIMPGFTHFQHAQPVLFSHYLMAYFWKLERDKERFSGTLKRVKVLPSGSCALAGTSLPVDREFMAKELGFEKVSPNSMDAVSERDFLIEYLFSSSLLMMHLSRLSEELIIFSSPEFSFVRIEESFCTGSSIMPQKRNPDVLELIRGKTAILYGYLFTLLSAMKNLPLTYNRDMQEDKRPLLETEKILLPSLEIMSRILLTLKVNKKRMEEMAGKDYTLATDLVEYLVERGMSFRNAYQLVGEMVKSICREGKEFKDLTLEEWEKFSPLLASGIKDLLSLEKSVERKNSYGGTSPQQVRKQIKEGKELLDVEMVPQKD